MHGGAGKTVYTSSIEYKEVYGGLAQQKLFVETLRLRPPKLPENVRREVKTCTVQAGALNPREVGPVGRKYFEATQNFCLFPPNDYLRGVGFPEYFNWCSADELLDSIKPFFTCPADTATQGCGGWTPALSCTRRGAQTMEYFRLSSSFLLIPCAD